MSHQTVIVLDFGGQYNQLIARRVRECNVYCEVKPYTTPLAELKAMNPIGIIFTGGPNSVYLETSPHVDPEIFTWGVPILGICYGCQLMAHALGGQVTEAQDDSAREYGKTKTYYDTTCKLFRGLPEEGISWMSHGDYMAKVPQGFDLVAHVIDDLMTNNDMQFMLLGTGDERFENFDLSLYGEAKESMNIVFETCREYASSFSERSMNLLFQGGTGLGKTFLSACIARVVAQNGHSVCYDTAASALEAFELKKFARDAEAAEKAATRVDRMLECELMILDDLGTEMLTQISVSALYTLINTRLVEGKKTIISTNLTDAELARRYTPQICSRIDGEFLKLPFVGTDIRMIKKEM